MKALTIWQPWASLIMVGAKPHEFRRWRCHKNMIGQRIVIHAGARKIKPGEIFDLLERLEDPDEETGLVKELAWPILQRVARALSGAPILPTGAGLGTAVLGQPVKCTELYADQIADSDRIDQHMWAWPVTDIEPFDAPEPMRGAQGFWNWPTSDSPPSSRSEIGSAGKAATPTMKCLEFETGKTIERRIVERRLINGQYQDVPLLKPNERLEYVVGSAEPLIIRD